jgi:para-aminobenzoate synthetase/4-amino-4-deoxychorismate lyase
MQGIDSDSIRKLTAALEGMREFVFFETCRPSRENNRSFLFTDPVCRLECTCSDDVGEFLNSAELYSRRGFFLAGWFAYEFGYLLEPALKRLLWPGKAGRVVARLGVFEKPLVFDHITGSFSGGNDWPKAEGALSTATINNLKTNISRQEFLADVEKISRYIKAGDTYQVNYTFKLDFSFTGSPAVLYRQLRRNQSVAYGAWIRSRGLDIMSFSPELFFSSEGNSIRVRPMKGTLVRGRNMEEDRQMSARLSSDGKSRSENVMIVDLLRNDLSRLLNNTGGGVVKVRSLFDVEVYESLLQMTSTVEGIANPSSGIGLADMLKSLFPCGSVTGAPKIRTMEIIRELEKEPRNVYCGAIGYCGPGKMCFNVPIRPLTLEGEKGSMGIGAGIVFDSDPKSEWRECLLKGRFLTHRRPEFQLIETLGWQPENGYVLLQEHLDRLKDSAAYFFFQLDLADVRNRLHQEETSFADTFMRVRLLLAKDGRVSITSTPLPDNDRKEELPKVAFSSHLVDPEDPFLYHKTTLRDLYNRKREEATERGLYELLFTNTRGEVTEGTISTLFVKRNGQMYTPPVSCGLLPGTFRSSYLSSGKSLERILTSDDVMDADALYVANSVRGLVRVELVD